MKENNHVSVTLTDDNFQQEVIESTKPVLVDFWAPWCGPCRTMEPVVEGLAKDYESRAVVGKVNVDDYQAVAARYGIQSIPTFLVFRDGKVVDRMVGTVSQKALEERLNGLLAAA